LKENNIYETNFTIKVGDKITLIDTDKKMYSNQKGSLKQTLKHKGETHWVYLRYAVNGVLHWFRKPAGWLLNIDTKSSRLEESENVAAENCCNKNPREMALLK